MFSKILIANRGEIACRIIRTARRMGIKTVAVYSEADDGALHVRDADEAVAIGAAPAAESYLRMDKIIEVAKQTGAQAIHPGFGFLSENEAFCQALEDEGLVFIGPGRKAIAAMGDKIASKRLAAEAGVSVVPGRVDPLSDADEAADFAEEIGYPVMLKASAGGGGKGMRIARSRDDVVEGFRSASNEARNSFGDERLFVEKFVERPRHIEIQVLADSHGTVLHLGERECSIQRRHQKVIEEAPSPFVDDKLRTAMGAQAVALAKAVDYRSAGTVEFIVDPQGAFYFLEMNTRLQVEHPVTELVTGLDIVEQMIRVAAGEKLAFSQSDISMTGWAVEARLYAEDPTRGYLPSIGQLQKLRWTPDDAIRIDTGVAEGDEVSIYYDPMVAKVVSSGADREDAIDKLIDALDGTQIDGLGNNAGMLVAVLDHPRFRAGDLSTAFLDEEYGAGFQPIDLEQPKL
ncbi:MAG: acetyl-CoA carboxylase biotin carboxylase subunit, partial [Pseudomonadota bacterium]